MLFLSFDWDKIGFSFHRWFWNAPYAESVKERLAKFMFGYVLVKIMVIIGCIAIIFLLSIETGIQIQFENWEKKKAIWVYVYSVCCICPYTSVFYQTHYILCIIIIKAYMNMWTKTHDPVLTFCFCSFHFLPSVCILQMILRWLLSANPLFLWLLLDLRSPKNLNIWLNWDFRMGSHVFYCIDFK